MQQPAIEISNLSFSYGCIPLLSRINLAIEPHEIVCILGPNGSGKTTLLRLMLGLIEPVQGKVRVFGIPPQKARARIGYVPQQTLYDPQFPVSALDVVLMGRLGNGFWGRFSRHDKEQAIKALEETQVLDLARRPFASLSGGQRQRVLIARGLAASPDLLLLDEPTSNVDQLTVEKLYQVLKELSRKMTIVFVSHDLGLVSTIVTSVICVNQTAVLHPTSQLTGEDIRRLYTSEMSLVRHDHRCAETGHCHV